MFYKMTISRAKIFWTILKSIAKYKGYVVAKEIEEIKISRINNLDEAIQQLDYKKVNLNN